MSYQRCPTCGSPQRGLQPAMQVGGEVQPCRDVWHSPLNTDIKTDLFAANFRCVQLGVQIKDLEEQLAKAKADNELLTACNESTAKSTAALWRILAPEYEGDSSIQEMASVLMKALANALKDSRRLDELESTARPTLVDGCGTALAVVLVYYSGHTLREAIDVMQGKEGEP